MAVFGSTAKKPHYFLPGYGVITDKSNPFRFGKGCMEDTYTKIMRKVLTSRKAVEAIMSEMSLE